MKQIMRQVMNTYNFTVAPENIDFKGQVTVPSICGDIINSIGQNIRKEGFGVDVMKEANRTWVLLRSAFEIDKRPGLYDILKVTVWPVPGDGITYNRCIKIADSEGKEIGRGTTEWCILDIESRKPIFPDLGLGGIGIGIPCKSPRRIIDFTPEITDERKVGYSSCDFNGHLNNTRYIEMFYDLLPEEILSTTAPVRLDINYRHEVSCGNDVSIGLKRTENGEFLFAARDGENTLCRASLKRLLNEDSANKAV
jgi:acyl-ACP thioesterase